MLRERIHPVGSGPVHVHASLYLALELEPVSERFLVHRRPLRVSLVWVESSRCLRFPLMDAISPSNRHDSQRLHHETSELEVHHSLDAVQPVLLEL